MRKLLIAISVALTIQGYSQKETSIGLEGGYSQDYLSPFDVNQSLIMMPLPSGTFGIIIRKGVSPNFFLESGLSSKYYWEGTRFSEIQYTWLTSEAFHSILIPIRAGFKVSLVKGFKFVPSGSFLTGIKTTPLDLSSGRGSVSNATTNIQYSYVEKEFSSPFFYIAELRLALEKRIKNSLRISLFYSRTFGFETVNELNVEYSINGTPYQGQYVSKGDYWCVGIGIAYLLKPKIKME